jgi:hypothetical protein
MPSVNDTTQQINENFPQQNFTPKPVSPLKTILLIVVGLVFVSAVACTAFLYGKNSQTPVVQEKEATSSTEKAKEELPVAVDETAGWKTYTNTKYGYSIKYPEDAVVKEFGGSVASECVSIVYKLNSITIASKDAGGGGCIRSGFAGSLSESYESVKIGDIGYTATVVEAKGDGETLDKHNKTALVKNVSDLNIEYGSTLDKNFIYTDYLKDRYLKQILSTFKFLNQELKGGTFINDNPKATVRYSLEYPAGWQVIDRQIGPRGAGSDLSRDSVTLSNGNVSIMIYQDATRFGGTGCLYPKDVTCKPEEYSCYRYGDFGELTISGVKVRRARFLSATKNTGYNPNSYYFCQDKDGIFISSTSVGEITYYGNQDISNDTLNEMDSIVGTIKILK